jgi:cobalt/nickel transport system ATP-binding protein
VSRKNKHPAIDATDVTYTYPDGNVGLKNFSFTANKGQFVALLASNGSGKTTLLKVIVGLLKYQQGKVLINGKEVRRLSQKKLSSHVGLVLQNPKDQLFSATVEEDVAFGPRNMGLPEKEVMERVHDCLEMVGASALIDRAIHHLSFGEQKRVALAGVLSMQPTIMVLDEPTAGLDPKGEARMMTLLSGLNRKQGVTIVMATHSVEMLPLCADRVYVLQKGSLLKEGSTAEIFSDREMLDSAGLRLPYITSLLDQMKRFDGVPIKGLPLTVREARKNLLSLIPEHLLNPDLKGDCDE